MVVFTITQFNSGAGGVHLLFICVERSIRNSLSHNNVRESERFICQSHLCMVLFWRVGLRDGRKKNVVENEIT